jgi:hypothetical protein
MINTLYCVKCEVDNGATVEVYNTYIFAPSASVAERRAVVFWRSLDNETTAEVIDTHEMSHLGYVCAVNENSEIVMKG